MSNVTEKLIRRVFVRGSMFHWIVSRFNGQTVQLYGDETLSPIHIRQSGNRIFFSAIGEGISFAIPPKGQRLESHLFMKFENDGVDFIEIHVPNPRVDPIGYIIANTSLPRQILKPRSFKMDRLNGELLEVCGMGEISIGYQYENGHLRINKIVPHFPTDEISQSAIDELQQFVKVFKLKGCSGFDHLLVGAVEPAKVVADVVPKIAATPAVENAYGKAVKKVVKRTTKTRERLSTLEKLEDSMNVTADLEPRTANRVRYSTSKDKSDGMPNNPFHTIRVEKEAPAPAP